VLKLCSTWALSPAHCFFTFFLRHCFTI
jgi:hypothetical protein